MSFTLPNNFLVTNSNDLIKRGNDKIFFFSFVF